VRCGLALAGAGPALLTARDVSGMDLLGTDLAALSATEPPAGAGQTGRAVTGLQRCFLLAGARAVLLSLWRGPEPQRLELLEDLYRRLLAGRPGVEALREAKLALRKRYPDPLYWGGFVWYGEPAALTTPG
jgi:CHAT domain-containing protein